MIKRLLEGKPLGHPLHTMLVHLPIGLFVLSFVLDILALCMPNASPAAYLHPSWYAMVFGVIMALVAALPGLVDYFDIRRDHPARPIATWHMLLNIAAVVIYFIDGAIRCRQWEAPRLGTLPLVLSFAGIGLISISGYLGGVMVYDDGIGVGRHRRSGKTPVKTLDLGSASDFVPVADEKDLAEKQTLRAEINGTVLVVAKQDGKLFAFQEFCTHRYGPLSEGAFKDGGMIVCPWHGSCFDMKTGVVCHGPAKEPIKTFEVTTREGKVMVRVTGSTRKD